MIEPIFTSKLRYGLELICNSFDSGDTVTRKLHGLHRSAMKASLGLKNWDHPSDFELLTRTGQKSVTEMVRIATASMAWHAGQDWDRYPLTAGRIDKHLGQRTTRQTMQRSLPPQSLNTSESLISRLVEMWEEIPENVKSEQHWRVAKNMICDWVNETNCDDV